MDQPRTTGMQVEARAFGEAGLVEGVPFEPGVQEYVLFVGGFPLEEWHLPVTVGRAVVEQY